MRAATPCRVLPARATTTTPSAIGRSGTTSPATTSGAQSRITTSVIFLSRSASRRMAAEPRSSLGRSVVLPLGRTATRRIEHGFRYGAAFNDSPS